MRALVLPEGIPYCLLLQAVSECSKNSSTIRKEAVDKLFSELKIARLVFVGLDGCQPSSSLSSSSSIRIGSTRCCCEWDAALTQLTVTTYTVCLCLLMMMLLVCFPVRVSLSIFPVNEATSLFECNQGNNTGAFADYHPPLLLLRYPFCRLFSLGCLFAVCFWECNRGSSTQFGH